MLNRSTPERAGAHLSVWQKAEHLAVGLFTGKYQEFKFDRGMMSVTFDDFPRSAWLNGGPILRRVGARATYYVSGCFCDGTMDGVPYYRSADLKEIVSDGHELGCHTFDHVSTFETDVETYDASVQRNRRFVDQLLPGYQMRSHALPYGHARVAHRRALARAFDAVRGARRPRQTQRNDRTLLRAAGLEECQTSTVNWPKLIAMTARCRGWLIVYIHGVTDRPGPHDTRPEILEGVLSTAAEHGLGFATISEVLSRR